MSWTERRESAAATAPRGDLEPPIRPREDTGAEIERDREEAVADGDRGIRLIGEGVIDAIARGVNCKHQIVGAMGGRSTGIKPALIREGRALRAHTEWRSEG